MVQSRLFPQRADRGVTGIDLVDFLDGGLELGGDCSAVASRRFPYDFAGPVACPAP